MTRRTALTGGAAAIAATVLEACGGSSSTSSSAATTSAASGGGAFGNSKSNKFVMVNHVTTNSFFTATIYGCQDACALTGSSFQWTGSNELDRQPDGLGVQQRHRRKRGRDRVLSDRQHRLQLTRRPGAERGHSGDRVQRRRLAGRQEQPDGLRRPEQPHRGRRGRGGDPQIGHQVGRPGRRDHRDSGDGEHPAADRRREARPEGGRGQFRWRSGPRQPRARRSTTRSPPGTPGTRTSSG